MALTEEQFFEFWERFANSDLIEQLPEDIEEHATKLGITVDYYLLEFL